MSGTVTTDQMDSTTGLPSPQKSTNGAAHTHLATIDSALITNIPPFNATLFSATAAGSTITSSLEDYNDWTFQVSFADATNTIQILGSLDGITFVPLSLMDLAAGTVVTTVVSVASGALYKIAVAANIAVKPVPFKAIKVTKGGAGATAIAVVAFGGWSA